MKLKVTVAALIAACWTAAAFAAPIGSNDVARAMGNWRHRGGTLGAKMGEKVKDVRKVEKDGAEFYIVRFEGGGHLIAPTDTKLRPVVLFSEADDFDLDERNPALALVVADVLGETDRFGVGGEQGPKTASFAAAPRSRNENAWADLLNDDIDAEYWDPIDDARVGPLCTTAWNQGSFCDDYCYNYYTPNHALCGCVATALAQIIRYFEWPKGDVPKFTSEWTQLDNVSTNITTQGGFFDWANMPDCNPTNTTSLSETQRQAIGKLTSDVGILAGMHYTSTGGSSSWTTLGRYVLTQTVLGYSNAMMIRIKNDAPTGAEEGFKRAVIANFNAKRPVQFGIEGHSIVGDGYGYHKGELYYHLNLGWSGHWTCWYSVPVNAENPIAGDTSYTYFKSIIYNIYTDESPDLVILSGRVTDKYSKDPVASQGVTAYAADGKTPVATATTDEKGIYSMLVLPGTYTVVASNETHDHKHSYYGSAVGEALRCVTQENKGQSGTQSPYGPAEMGNCADCDLEMENVDFEPEAEVTIGEVSGQTNFTCATIPVTAKVIHYGQTAEKAVVVVKLKPVGGGMERRCDSDVFGGFAEYGFNASFTGLEAGVTYRVEAKVIMVGTGEQAGLGDGSFAEAREFVWFDETAASFTAAKWSGGKVEVGDGGLTVLGFEGNETRFTPEPADPCATRIVIKFRENGAYPKVADIPNPEGPVGISAVDAPNDRTELVVWGNGVWNSTGILLGDDEADVTVDLDFIHHSIRYGVNGTDLGPYALADSIDSVSSVFFKGYSILSELGGTVQDANLVKDANGTEYANYEAAKAGGATGVLSPLWLSTWNLAGGSGTLDVNDPLGLITFTGASKVLKSETQPDGSERKWYAEANDADVAAGAAKYIQTTVDLGLAKAITDDSIVKIGDFAVAEGSMSFKVEIDDVEVAKATINDLVEVSGDLDMWKKPKEAGATIGFNSDTHVITVTPPAGPRGFVRVKVPSEKQ